MCPFNGNIPQPNDLLNASQADLLSNYAELKTAIDINHYTFGDLDEGMHKWVSYPVDVVPRNEPPLAGEIITKCSTSRFTNRPELAYQSPAIASNRPLSERIDVAGAYQTGWATLSGKRLIIKWGLSEGLGGLTTFRFPEGPGTPPFVNPPYTMQIVPLCPPGFATNIFARLVAIVDANTFSVMCTQRTTNNNAIVPFFWLAIGTV